ncbi:MULTISPECIES: hypothetical protein [unclassified Caulobacter]|uniref:hypothetical protein n=1 Tax=unclassified Caulobacter TaxID=2648921 RepID=UPI0006FDA041|nr:MULTISPECIES: hypothetical protein [unclassified Caulobacter]KQV55288.1 hypothetical protein ASC62_21920 [Caulobacter sp. Root342]KQV63523.1 hypothetical protein ASC70_20725 [Caulobacter sp. Root343]
MNDPIDPIRRSGPARRALPAPRDSGRHETDEETVFVVEDETPPPPRPPRREGFAAFAAHVMGQSGQKRGLRGGQEVLDTARSTYLGTEYSGEADRRPKAGLLKKTNI